MHIIRSALLSMLRLNRWSRSTVPIRRPNSQHRVSSELFCPFRSHVSSVWCQFEVQQDKATWEHKARSYRWKSWSKLLFHFSVAWYITSLINFICSLKTAVFHHFFNCLITYLIFFTNFFLLKTRYEYGWGSVKNFWLADYPVL